MAICGMHNIGICLFNGLYWKLWGWINNFKFVFLHLTSKSFGMLFLLKFYVSFQNKILRNFLFISLGPLLWSSIFLLCYSNVSFQTLRRDLFSKILYFFIFQLTPPLSTLQDNFSTQLDRWSVSFCWEEKLKINEQIHLHTTSRTGTPL